MTVHLDHLMIPAKNKEQAAERLANILGVSWSPAKVGPFAAVYVNDGLTIDFDEWNSEFAKGHYCFRVTEAEFEVILGRLKGLGIAYRSLPQGEVDNEVNHFMGGRVLYWSEPDGHVWELLTESYARGNGTGAA